MKKSEPWDIGHLPGHEFRRINNAQEKRTTRKKFLDSHNNPDLYGPEIPASNRSHALADMSALF